MTEDIMDADVKDVDEPTGEEDLDLYESTWGARARVSRISVLLVAGIVAAAAFAGGVLVQKRHDAGLSSNATAGAQLGRFFGGGGGGSEGAFPSGGPAAAIAGANGTSGSSGSGGAGAAAAPVVVGTVVSVKGTDLRVKNFAGTVVVVHVPAGTPVTTPGLVPLAAGMTVSVTGTKAADGSVNAAGVVSRRAG